MRPKTHLFITSFRFYQLNALSEGFMEVLHLFPACICGLTYIRHIVAGGWVTGTQ